MRRNCEARLAGRYCAACGQDGSRTLQPGGAQLPPSRLYLVAGAVYFFVAPRLGAGVIRLDGRESTAYPSFGPLTWDSELLLVALVPAWAVGVRLLLGRRRFYEEAFVFSVHFNVFSVHFNVFYLACLLTLAVVVATCNALQAPGAAIVATALLGLVPLPYLMVALRRAFDLGVIRAAAYAVALYLAHIGLGQGIFNLLTAVRA